MGNLFRTRTLICMENFEYREKKRLTKEEREAKKELAQQKADGALGERRKADDAFRANFERLKAQRLAREANGD